MFWRLIVVITAIVMSTPSWASTKSLTSYGAKCNGVTNDAPAISRAFADAGTVWTVLEFPTGKICRIASGIDVVNKGFYRVNGNGSTIKAVDGMAVVSGNQLLHFKGGGDCQLYNLTVDGNRAKRKPAEEPAHNIQFTSVDRVELHSVRSINSVTDGIYVHTANKANPTTFPTELLFDNVHALNSFRNGLSIINADGVIVSGGRYSDNRGTWPQAGIDLESNDGSAVPGNRNILIFGALLENNNGFGVQVSAKATPTDITIQENILRNNARGGVRVNGRNIAILDNLLENHNRGTVPCPNSKCHRAVIEVPSAATVGPYLVDGNVIRNSKSDVAAIMNHSAVKGLRVSNNCLEDVLPKPFSNGGGVGTYVDNVMNPAGGCLDPGL